MKIAGDDRSITTPFADATCGDQHQVLQKNNEAIHCDGLDRQSFNCFIPIETAVSNCMYFYYRRIHLRKLLTMKVNPFLQCTFVMCRITLTKQKIFADQTSILNQKQFIKLNAMVFKVTFYYISTYHSRTGDDWKKNDSPPHLQFYFDDSLTLSLGFHQLNLPLEIEYKQLS